MLDVIRETIDRIYVNQDYEYYLERCQTNIVLPEELWKTINAESGSVSIEHKGEEFFPSVKLILEYEPVKKGEFEAVFKTNLMISKLAPLYHIDEEFEIKNSAKDAVIPVLKGNFMEMTIEQFVFREKLIEILEQDGYTCLGYGQIIEVVFDVSIPAKTEFSPSQITVGDLIFNDLLNLCHSKL